MVYVIIATTLVCVLFDPVIPTSSFNFIKMFFILVNDIANTSIISNRYLTSFYDESFVRMRI